MLSSYSIVYTCVDYCFGVYYWSIKARLVMVKARNIEQ